MLEENKNNCCDCQKQFYKEDLLKIHTPQSKFKIILVQDSKNQYITKILISKNDKIVIYGKSNVDMINRLMEIINGLQKVIDYLNNNKI